ncbi:YbaN family protein [Marinospirillum insulare]|uniref:Inner membrane protein n=1 Tax=Marinospirillum insulare TaxID=217169 RepID=A0ABQ6A049_9GAMM|nr:YbaN family protein [Marinospirillum insulare]GLR64617.1 inner membrane protein [Marinospirillum insulare]
MTSTSLPAPKLIANPLVRRVVFIFGWFSFVMGVIGIFLPLLPTTPFILLAAACFARSSPRFYAWITSHHRYGPMIANYLAGKGLPLKAKLMAIGLLWISVSFTLFIVSLLWAKLAMLATALAVSAYILWRLPTLKTLDS